MPPQSSIQWMFVKRSPIHNNYSPVRSKLVRACSILSPLRLAESRHDFTGRAITANAARYFAGPRNRAELPDFTRKIE
jgi:hypothetical protein